MLETLKVFDKVFCLFVTGVCLSQNVVLQVALFLSKQFRQPKVKPRKQQR